MVVQMVVDSIAAVHGCNSIFLHHAVVPNLCASSQLSMFAYDQGLDSLPSSATATYAWGPDYLGTGYYCLLLALRR